MTAEIKLNTKQLVELKALASFGENGTVWPTKDAQKFEKLGVVELGGTVGDGSEVQIRINAEGSQYLKDMEPAVDNGSENKQNANHNGNDAEPKKTTGGNKPMFQIQSNVEIPKAARRSRTSAYPFDQLEVGQSFFVPASEERPDPAKTMGSTVAAANERYSEVVEGQTRINRKGKEVPMTRQVRQFKMAAVADGAAWGHPGVSGAGVWRIEPTEAGSEDNSED